MLTASFDKYRLQHVAGQVGDELADEAVKFWLRNGALTDRREARQRAAQLFWIARNVENELIAVCTLYTMDYGSPPSPHYTLRVFVREQDRKSGLAVELVRLTRERLAATFQPGQAEQGLILTSQNPVLMHPAAQDLFRRWGWTLMEQTSRGFDVWRLGNENMYPHPPGQAQGQD
jgi:hypothetical protein